MQVRDTQKGKAELRACAAAMSVYLGRGRTAEAPAVEELKAYIQLHTVKKRVLGQHPTDPM